MRRGGWGIRVMSEGWVGWMGRFVFERANGMGGCGCSNSVALRRRRGNVAWRQRRFFSAGVSSNISNATQTHVTTLPQQPLLITPTSLHAQAIRLQPTNPPPYPHNLSPASIFPSPNFFNRIACTLINPPASFGSNPPISSILDSLSSYNLSLSLLLPNTDINPL